MFSWTLKYKVQYKHTTQGELWQLLCLGNRRSNVDAGWLDYKVKYPPNKKGTQFEQFLSY